MQHPILKFQENPPRVYLCHEEGEFEISSLWLREKSQDSSAVDHSTRQRLFDSHLLDPNTTLTSLKKLSNDVVALEFSDGHASDYQVSQLMDDLIDRTMFPEPVPWNSSLAIDTVRYDWQKMKSDISFQAALKSFLTYGFIVLHDVPTQPEQILEVARKFGYIKETNFGTYFEVYSKPSANDLAYRSVRLGPHTDNPYRDPVPGIQLLHCLTNETSGGLSTLVDSVAVVDRLMQIDPAGYGLLKNTPVLFQFIDQGTHLKSRRSMIQTDSHGRTLGVHYSPRLDSLPLTNDANTRAFHRARMQLAELFNSPEFELQFRLAAGELMLFDNSRVLHGRTAYDPNEGHRHLQGCYIDLDGPKERYASIDLRTRNVQEVA